MPPPNKQRKLSGAVVTVPGGAGIPAGATIVVVSSGSSGAPVLVQRPTLSSSAAGQPAGQPVPVRAALRPQNIGAMTGIRLRLAGSSGAGGQVLVQRPVSGQQILVRNTGPFTLPTIIPRSSPASSPAPSSPSPAATPGSVSCLSSSNSSMISTTPAAPSVANTIFLSHSLNNSAPLTMITSLSSSLISSPSVVAPPQTQQFIIRYCVPTPAHTNPPLQVSPVPLSPLQTSVPLSPASLTLSPIPSPSTPASPKSPRSLNPQQMIQQITQPCTPPPAIMSPVQTSPRQPVVLRAARNTVQRFIIPAQIKQPAPVSPGHLSQLSPVVIKTEDENFTRPLPPLQTSVKTVRTTLLPRSPVSDDQISSILQNMVPEPQSQVTLSPEEKEKVSAVAAQAANNFDEGKLSPSKSVSPAMSPRVPTPTTPTNLLPIIQPLELPENGGDFLDDDSSLDNVTIPEIPEELNSQEQEKSGSKIVLKVSSA